MSILSKKKTSTLWILLVQGGSYSYKVELTFTIDLFTIFLPVRESPLLNHSTDYVSIDLGEIVDVRGFTCVLHIPTERKQVITFDGN